MKQAFVLMVYPACHRRTLRTGYIGGYSQPVQKAASGGGEDGKRVAEEMSEGEREAAAAAAAKAKSDALTLNGIAFAAGLASTLALLAGERIGSPSFGGKERGMATRPLFFKTFFFPSRYIMKCDRIYHRSDSRHLNRTRV